MIAGRTSSGPQRGSSGRPNRPLDRFPGPSVDPQTFDHELGEARRLIRGHGPTVARDARSRCRGARRTAGADRSSGRSLALPRPPRSSARSRAVAAPPRRSCSSGGLRKDRRGRSRAGSPAKVGSSKTRWMNVAPHADVLLDVAGERHQLAADGGPSRRADQRRAGRPAQVDRRPRDACPLGDGRERRRRRRRPRS